MQFHGMARWPSARNRREPWSAREAGFSLVDLLFALALIGIVAGLAVPVTGSAVAGQRFKADSQALANMVGLAKMRASAAFTRARVRANVADNSFVLERWDKTTAAWVTEDGMLRLSSGVAFGTGGIGTPPPNTQSVIGMSPPCRAGISAADASIGGTACIVFNSRGLPVDGTGALFGGHALYLTDGGTVAAVTITATPRIRRWVAPASSGTWRTVQ